MGVGQCEPLTVSRSIRGTGESARNEHRQQTTYDGECGCACGVSCGPPYGDRCHGVGCPCFPPVDDASGTRSYKVICYEPAPARQLMGTDRFSLLSEGNRPPASGGRFPILYLIALRRRLGVRPRLCNAFVGQPFQADQANPNSMKLGKRRRPGKADLRLRCKAGQLLENTSKYTSRLSVS